MKDHILFSLMSLSARRTFFEHLLGSSNKQHFKFSSSIKLLKYTIAMFILLQAFKAQSEVWAVPPSR